MSRRIDWDKAKRQQKAVAGLSVIDAWISPSQWGKMRRKAISAQMKAKAIRKAKAECKKIAASAKSYQERYCA